MTTQDGWRTEPLGARITECASSLDDARAERHLDFAPPNEPPMAASRGDTGAAATGEWEGDGASHPSSRPAASTGRGPHPSHDDVSMTGSCEEDQQ